MNLLLFELVAGAVCLVEKVVDVFVCDVDNHVVAED